MGPKLVISQIIGQNQINKNLDFVSPSVLHKKYVFHLFSRLSMWAGPPMHACKRYGLCINFKGVLSWGLRLNFDQGI